MSLISKKTELTAAELVSTDIEMVIDRSAGTSGTKRMSAASKAIGFSKLLFFEDSGGDDAYVISTGASLTTLSTGMRFWVKVTTGNTGACTLTVDSAGAITIKDFIGSAKADPETGRIPAGSTLQVEYDGTDFLLLHVVPQLRGIVAASNSNNKHIAQYVCDGTADDVQINAAITEAAALSINATVILLSGTYNVTGRILKKTNVNIMGYGAIIKMAASLDTNAVSLIECEAGDHSYTQIAGVELDGNESNNRSYPSGLTRFGHGIVTMEYTPGSDFNTAPIGVASNVVIKDVYAHDVVRTNFCIAGYNHKLYNITAENSLYDHLIYMTGANGCTIQSATLSGFCAGQDSMVIFSNQSPTDSAIVCRLNSLKNIKVNNIAVNPATATYPRYVFAWRGGTMENIVDGCDVQMEVTPSDNSRFLFWFATTGAIGGNTIYRSGIRGLNYRGQIGSSGLGQFNYAEGCFISGQIYMFADSASTTPVFRLGGNCKNLDLSNLTVDATAMTHTMNVFSIDNSTGSVDTVGLNLKNFKVIAPNATIYMFLNNVSVGTHNVTSIETLGFKYDGSLKNGTVNNITMANEGIQGDGAYNNGHLLIGNYHLWIDSTGRLRIKSSTPSSDTDGTIVGTQS
jgi:hypothetical protein